MAVVIKRSAGAVRRQECGYGCCSPVHGKTGVRLARRAAKRASERAWRRDGW